MSSTRAASSEASTEAWIDRHIFRSLLFGFGSSNTGIEHALDLGGFFFLSRAGCQETSGQKSKQHKFPVYVCLDLEAARAADRRDRERRHLFLHNTGKARYMYKCPKVDLDLFNVRSNIICPFISHADFYANSSPPSDRTDDGRESSVGACSMLPGDLLETFSSQSSSSEPLFPLLLFIM